ncbi:MAG: hypothetical protein E6J14_15070 [Chloroflexi bacterium]|nr:MAG: hypothetical protein E6J14_15070 [Chloroflexota bacterium]
MSAAGWVGGALLAATPMPRPVRYRLRLRHADAARSADAIAGAALPVVLTTVVLTAVLAAVPVVAAGLRPLWAGVAIGLLTGVPFVLERRGLRRRLQGMTLPPDPVDQLPDDIDLDAVVATVRSAGDAPDLDGMRVLALATASVGDSRSARAYALRTAQLDPERWEVLLETGWTLCLRGRFGEGVRLLDRASQLRSGDPRSERVHAAGLLLAGRLRDAVAALNRAEGRPGERPLGLARRSANPEQSDVQLHQQRTRTAQADSEDEVGPADRRPVAAPPDPREDGDAHDAEPTREEDHRGDTDQTAREVTHGGPER